ncbi:MAG: hypothetical protein RIR02_1478 [Pseudomonadota bacterium]|jgi:lipopolysaccharide/colanic/teichoic acid biosynthesis glycosyltransferase
MKRGVDVVLSLLAMLVLMPFAILIALLIWLETRGPILARPHRVGRHGRMVKVFEFHTAVTDPDAMEMVGGCHGEQVTRVGAVLRRLGISQWPLLINVLRGDLSLVGPRAELPRYVGCYPTEDRKLILSIKPGLVDLATIEFTDEKSMLAGLEGDDLEQAYVEQVLPKRLDYAKRYMAERGFWLDARIILLGLARGFLR